MAAHELASTIDDEVPLEGWAGVGFVGLDVVMAEDAFVGVVLFGGEGVGDEFAVFVLGVITLELGEDGAERGGELGEGGVLLGGEVVLALDAALDFAGDHFIAGGMADEVGGEDAAAVEAFGNGEGDDAGGGVFVVPLGERGGGFFGGIGAHVGDFDADGAVIGFGGLAGAFFEVEGLINGAVDVEHEVNGEVAIILEGFEAVL